MYGHFLAWAWPCSRLGLAGASGRASRRVPRRRDPSRGWSSRWRRRPSRTFLRRGLRPSAKFDAAHGWGVNLFSVVALAADRRRFSSARNVGSYLRGSLAGTLLCLADWVLVQDFGFFGGVGTDPNSMVPMALVFIAGYLAVTRLPTRLWPASPATASCRSQLAGTAGGRTRPIHSALIAALGRARRNADRDRSDGPCGNQPSLRRPDPGSGFDGTPETFDFR